MFRKLTEYKNKDKIQVGFFDTASLDVKYAEMFMEGFKVKLHKDNQLQGIVERGIHVERVLDKDYSFLNDKGVV